MPRKTARPSGLDDALKRRGLTIQQDRFRRKKMPMKARRAFMEAQRQWREECE